MLKARCPVCGQVVGANRRRVVDGWATVLGRHRLPQSRYRPVERRLCSGSLVARP